MDFCFFIWNRNHPIARLDVFSFICLEVVILILFILGLALSSEATEEKLLRQERRKKGHRNSPKRSDMATRRWYTLLFLVGGKDKVLVRHVVNRSLVLIPFLLIQITVIANQIQPIHWVVDLLLLSMNFFGIWMVYLHFRHLYIHHKNRDVYWISIIVLVIVLAFSFIMYSFVFK